MVNGGTLLALGCFQSVPPEHFYRQLLKLDSGTASWHFTSCGNFVGRRILRGRRLCKRGIPDTHAHFKKKILEGRARDQAPPTDWTGKMTKPGGAEM